MAPYDLETLSGKVDLLEKQQQYQVQGLAEFLRNWRTNPARAEKSLETWLKAISPELDLSPGAPAPPVSGKKPILNVDGDDIRPALEAAVKEAGIPLLLALACVIAESGLNPRAERWGSLTSDARTAINQGDLGRLAQIIEEVWPDISFGYSQKIVLYHYLGDRSSSIENCLAVREGVFGDPEGNLRAMAQQLAGCLGTAQAGDLSPVGGDPLLGALVVYNAGHLPPAVSPWWDKWAGNVGSYGRAMAQAREMLEG